MSDEYYDEDGFRLEFEDDTSDQEKQFFMRAFPNVNKIAERKVHCTSCYMHIGTAPITEAIIRMHPVLRVSHCRNCHTFYNSGEFDKGEDGSELYCRWCGQGGEVYCCSKCPYVFCKKCIVQNLSRACVQDISRNDNWQCFSCAPKIMWHLRAQHWALVNYIEKQKKDMKDKNLSVQTINNLMKQDNTTCCSGKGQNKKTTTPIAPKKAAKRPSDATDFSPGAAKIPDNKRATPRPIMPVHQAAATPPSAKKAKTDNNEVVCTPDIMSMFMSPEEPPPLVAARTLPPAPKPTPPKPTPPHPAMNTTVPGRQVVVRPAIPANQAPVTMRMPTMANPANTAPPPVYHTINGYRIDLHTAAQQGTYRLPNGKLIQVRKQAPSAPPTPTAIPAARNIAPKPNTYYNPVSVAQAAPVRMTNGGTNMHINIALQQQQQLQEQRLQQQRQQQQQQQQQQQMIQQQRQQQLLMQQAQSGQPQPTIVAGQINPALQLPTLALLQNMVNGPHEDSPLGKSRKNFEGKLLSGVEICQHIVNKINTLTNSNSFKNIRNVRDLKELYIHVSYLLTYAIGRFKTLQEKCVDDVKKMGFTKESDFVMMGEQISNRNPGEDKSDDEDDCEIIEQSTTLIELDSEDEDDGGKKKKDEQANKSAQCPMETEAAVAAILQEKDDANTSSEPISVDSDERIVPAENESPSKDDSAAAADQPEPEIVSSEDTSGAKEVISVDSTETIAEKANVDSNKSDDDLVEIVDGDDKVESHGEASAKPDETAVASKDGEDANKDVVEISESTDAEQAQNKENDTTDKESEAAVAVSEGDREEDKQETTVATDHGESEQEKTEDVAEASADKEEDVAIVSDQEKQESPEAEVSDENKPNEEQDTEMESAEVEKTPEVECVETSKEGENENKENELPKEEDSNAAQGDEAVVEKEAEENDVVVVEKEGDEKDENDAGEQAEHSEAMEVDAQPEPEDKTESSCVADAEPKPSESEDTPASTEITEENLQIESTAEQSPEDESIPEQSPDDQSEVEAPEVATHEPEPAIAESHVEASNDDPLAEQPDSESQTPQIVAVESLVDFEAEQPTVETPPAEETSVEESCNKPSAIEAPVEPSSDAATDAVETPVEEMLDAPTGNELLAQIEDSFLKLQEMIESTEEATEEPSANQPTAVDQMTEAAVEAPSAQETENEQMEVDEEESSESAATSAMATPEEESLGATSEGAGSSAAEDKVEQQLLADCNGVLEENGTSNFNGIDGELAEMADVLGDEMLEISKMATAAEVENINSPEMISGDY